ncbi:MAG: hypothetical protein LBQ80_02005 [Clostridium sp.]|jgi:hypothetical protein|nr:hypothetical protein [Clostridium sp.]
MTNIARLKLLRRRVIALQYAISRAKADCTAIPSQLGKVGTPPVQATPAPAGLVRKLENLDALRADLEAVLCELRSELNQEDDADRLRVLRRYYLWGWRVEDIQTDLHMRKSNIIGILSGG